MPYAHSANANAPRQDLVAHLRNVADLAGQYAAAFDAGTIGALLGLWHDLGKFDPDWQRYLLASEAGHAKRGTGPDHKAAGTRLAEERLGLLALCVQGHHGGLRAPTEVRTFLEQHQHKPGVQEALRLAADAIPDLAPAERIALPEHVRRNNQAIDIYLRLLFSCLVDADLLDTERHYGRGQGAAGFAQDTMQALWERFQANQRRDNWARSQSETVREVRRQIYEDCLAAAELPTGWFRLAAPTGGGKTRSGMAFALRHAALHHLERVIVAVPFITITEQTASVYRGIFETDATGPVVLEHHSGVQPVDHPDDALEAGANWTRLATENWDAPVIVTTTVQLLESLFSNQTSRLRKVHRLARSVIILDEAQALPLHLLKTILSGLQELCAHYRTTVVISTATQPAFEAIPEFKSLQASDILRDASAHFQAMQRVTYEWKVDAPWSWTDVAQLMRHEQQALTIVNTKRDAQALLDALDDPDALHLSTLLCGAHRRQVIDEVRRRLAAGQPCRLVATQVVEAGVDLDFPLVLRALGPLDAIIQAAGRCNREGRLARGRVVVFDPAEGGAPMGAYRTAIGVTKVLLGDGSLNPDDPRAARQYYQLLLRRVELDRERIERLRKGLAFPDVGAAFRMIDDDAETIVVPFGTDEERRTVAQALQQLEQGTPRARALMRRIQPYTVAVRRREAERYRREGLIRTTKDIGEWLGDYDPVRGLTGRGLRLDELVV